MGEVTSFPKKHWVLALDADLASIPTPGVGDTAFTIDKKKLYYYNGTGWKTGLGYEYVPRAATGPDKQVGDFTTNGVYQVDGLDLSAIVPAGAVAVQLELRINDDAAGSYITLRQNAVALGVLLTEVIDVANLEESGHGILGIDSDRLLDYLASNVAFIKIDVTVLGWFI